MPARIGPDEHDALWRAAQAAGACPLCATAQDHLTCLLPPEDPP